MPYKVGEGYMSSEVFTRQLVDKDWHSINLLLRDFHMPAVQPENPGEQCK